LIKEYLVIIQTYKSSGCIERAGPFYSHYSKVEGDHLLMRELMLKNQRPRRVELMANLMWYNEENIHPVKYPECFEGIIHSWAERFPFTKELFD